MQSVSRLDTIADLPAMLREGDLLLLDVDETLVRSEPDATEPWFNAFVDALRHNGKNEKRVCFDAGVEVWQALQGVCAVAAPEGEATREALRAALRIPGVECVGLTARGPEVDVETVAQLKRCGLYEGVFATRSLGELAPASAGDRVAPLTHLHGIIYCSGSRKPAGCRAFEAAAAIPSTRRVVLLDDRESHCHAVAEDCRARGRPFLGVHYAHGSADAECVLPRSWQLVAAIIGDSSGGGRQKMRQALDAMGKDDADVGGDARSTSPRVALALVVGACVGGAAVWTALKAARR